MAVDYGKAVVQRTRATSGQSSRVVVVQASMTLQQASAQLSGLRKLLLQ